MILDQAVEAADTLLGVNDRHKDALAQRVAGMSDDEVRAQFTSGGPDSAELVDLLRQFQKARGY